ncbi:hypothetical protein [Roseococcus sp. YIM B11640]|uniref:hypothetical protein n=1 Tax=Roseococcus sp. YIM B11640 TaxID=3133973 RepID=UPI003C7DB780
MNRSLTWRIPESCTDAPADAPDCPISGLSRGFRLGALGATNAAVNTPADREARLAAALRANLRRRKAQARGREDARAAEQPGGPSDGRPAPEEARPASPEDAGNRKDR